MAGTSADPDAPNTVQVPLFAGIDISHDVATVLLPVQFTYHAADPYAVTLSFRANQQDWVEWMLARDLLADGLDLPSGDGDVHIAPTSPTEVRVRLDSPDGRRAYAFPRADLQHALDATERLVRTGWEPALIDWPYELALLGGDP